MKRALLFGLAVGLLAGCGDGDGLRDEQSLHVKATRSPCLSYTIDGTPQVDTSCPTRTPIRTISVEIPTHPVVVCYDIQTGMEVPCSTPTPRN
jgi:hypothetical protein